MECCRARKLDPFVQGQVYMMRVGGKYQVVVGIDGLRKIADRTGCYAPGPPSEITYDTDGKLLSATVFVKKMTSDGTWHTSGETAYAAEYAGRTGPWQSHPTVMLKKCSESLSLRRAFSSETSGIYSDTELEATRDASEDGNDGKVEEENNGDVGYDHDCEWFKKALVFFKSHSITKEDVLHRLGHMSDTERLTDDDRTHLHEWADQLQRNSCIEMAANAIKDKRDDLSLGDSRKLADRIALNVMRQPMAKLSTDRIRSLVSLINMAPADQIPSLALAPSSDDVPDIPVKAEEVNDEDHS